MQRLEPRRLLAADGLQLAVDSIRVEQNSAAIAINVLANDSFDSDYVGDGQISSVSTGSLGGRIEIASGGGSLRYTPPADADGTETFRYWVDDLQSADVTVKITSPLRPFFVTIYQFQDEYKFDLLTGAQFLEGYAGEERISLISETADGAEVRITNDGKSVLYRSRIGVAGQDRFTFIVDDRYVGTALINVVNPLRHDRYEVIQNSGTTNLDVLSNDFVSGADAGINLQEVRGNARITHVLNDSDDFQVEISGDGRSIDFTPATDYSNLYSTFRYVVDGRFEQTVRVAVQRPVRDDFFRADVDGGLHTLDVLENDRYYSIIGYHSIRIVDRITAVTQGDHGGAFSISDDGTRIFYTPAEGFTGTEQFEYVADGQHSATGSVYVTQPVRDDSTRVRVGSTTPIDVLANDFASDATVVATITSVTESKIGASIQVDNGGALLYTPPEDALTRESPVYSDTFEYTVDDQYTATVRVTLGKITASDTYSVDQPTIQTLRVLENDYFDQNYVGAIQITSVSDPTGGSSVTISPDGRSLIYQGVSDRESFTYTVDGKFTETIRIDPIRRLVADRAVADRNGSAITIDVTANDFPSSVATKYGSYQGNRIVTSVTQSEQGGVVSITADGNASYLPPHDFVGRDSFSYEIDGFLTEDVRVDVVRRVADDLVRVAADSQDERLNVLANDILGADYLGGGLITSVTTSDAGAEIRIAEDGRSIAYTPPIGFEGRDTFVYTLDGQFEATVSVVVQDGESGLVSKFQSVAELRDYLLALSIERFDWQYGQPTVPYGRNIDYDVEFTTTGLSGGLDFSETNVQVAGVDEDDIVETDGSFIYSLRGDELAIIKSFPADEMELLSRTEIEGTPVGMYLSGDRVTVISRLYEFEDPIPVPFDDLAFAAPPVGDRTFSPYPSRPGKTVLTVLDVADRAKPSVVQRTIFDGEFSKSRRIDDQVFLVLESPDLLFEPELICEEGESGCVYESEQQFTDRVLRDFALLIEEKLPDYESYDGNGELVRGGPIVLPEDIYRSADGASSMTIVASINMASHEPGLAATSGVMAESNSDIHASAEHLYVFNRHREPIENEPWTQILKFNWDGQSGAIEFAAIGDVPGTLLNQFSADEYDGLLRVTTKISNTATGNFSNRDETGLFVLQDDNGVLEFVGRIQNLAVGDDVKSVRYFGDRAFVTTFQTIDPLHAIDLSDPTNPQTLGNVSIPGFSSYMQFIAEDRLLTVGTNTATGFGGRAMVSLFDVGDLTSPRLVQQYNLPKFSTSQANLDHRAFGWFARHDLLAVPIRQRYQDRFDDDSDGYREAIRVVEKDALSLLDVGVDVDSGAERITLRGRIDHDAAVLRSVYVNDNVYSIGLDAIRTVNLADPTSIVGEVFFDDDSPITSVDPRTAFDFNALALAARQNLANHKGIEIGSVMLVTREQRDGSVDLVLRAGDRDYRYHGTSEEDLQLKEEAFRFFDNWHNSSNANDANGDGQTTASDALMVINELFRRGESRLPVDRALRQVNAIRRFVDTNGDGRVTAADALKVINHLGRLAVASSSGESNRPSNGVPSLLSPQSIDNYFNDDETHRGILF